MTSCLPGWGGAEGRLSQIKCVENFEHRVEARDTQDIPDPFRGVHQLQVSSLLVGLREQLIKVASPELSI